MTYRKSDVTLYYSGGRNLPAVNVKVYKPLPDTADNVRDDARAWAEEHLSEQELYAWWQAACESGAEQAAEYARELFGDRAHVYFEGRSGGWCVVEGLPDVEAWDALMLSKWRRFESWTRAKADDVPAATLRLIEWNVREPAEEHARDLAAALDVPDLARAVPAAARLAGA